MKIIGVSSGTSTQIQETCPVITLPSIGPIALVLVVMVAMLTVGLQTSEGVGAEEGNPTTSTLDEWVFRPPEHAPPEVVPREYSYLRTPSMEVGPDGTVHVIWIEILGDMKAEVRYSRSADQGASWTASKAVSTHSTLTLQMPDMVIDAEGTITVSWTEDRLGDPAVQVVRSTDGGTTFSDPSPIGGLPDFPYILRSRLTVSEDGTVYASCLNAATRVLWEHYDGSYEYYYEDLAIGWSMSVGGGDWEDQRLVLALNTDEHVYNYDHEGPPSTLDADGALHIAFFDYNRTVFASTVNVSSSDVQTRSIPKRSWSKIDEDLEVVAYGNRVGVLFIEQEGSATWLHHAWYNSSSGGVIWQETMLNQSTGSSMLRCRLHDAAVDPGGTLFVLAGGTYDGVLTLLTMEMDDLYSKTRNEFRRGWHDIFAGGSLAPVDEGWGSLLICGGVSKYLPYEYDYGWSRDDLECMRWDRSTNSCGTPILIGRDVDYLPDRTGLRVAHGADGSVLSVWHEGRSYGGTVYFSARTNGSGDFSEPVALSDLSEHAYAYGEPDIAVDGSGSVHVVWFEHHIYWEAIPVVIMYTVSHDNGTTWSRPTSVATSSSGVSLSIAASPDGEVFLAYQSTWMIEDQMQFTIEVVRWEGELGDLTRSMNVAHVPQDGPYGRGIIRDIDLQVSKDGDPHIISTYRDPTSNETPMFIWLRSSDRGDTWSVARFLAPTYDLSEDASASLAVVDDDRIYLAMTTTLDDTSPPRVALRLLRANIRSGVDADWALYQGWEGHRPIAGATAMGTLPDGEVVVSALVLKAVGDAHPLESSTVSLVVFTTVPIDGIDGPRAVSTGLEDVVLEPGKLARVLDRSTLDISMDPWGAPTMAGVLVDDMGGHLGTYVWGVNHLPEVANLSAAGGEWVFGDHTDLVVMPAIDPDGDPLEYRFRIWTADGVLIANSTWQSLDWWAVWDLDHGEHLWSVEVRDGLERTTSPAGWTFRVDTGPPVPNPGGPYRVQEGTTITIDGSASWDDGGIVLWEWDLEDDGVFEVAEPVPSFSYTGADDLVTTVVLRVTDVAGRQGTGRTSLVVLNTPPACALWGHGDLTAGYTAHLVVGVTDDGVLDTHTITWSLEDGQTGEGSDISVYLPMPGTFTLRVVVEDDDGGVCLEEFALEVGHKELSIALVNPAEVWTGEGFVMHIVDNYDQPLETLEVSWYIDGVAAGTGRHLLWTASTAGTYDIRVDAEDPVGHRARATGELRARERLTPVVLVGTADITGTSVTVEWTACEQVTAFERYSVVVSTRPLVSPPSSHAGDGWETDPGNETWVDVADRNDTTLSLRDLEPGTTYFLRVDVIGDDQRAFSNVVSFETPGDAPGADDGDPDVWDPHVSGPLFAGIIVGVIAIAVAGTIVRRQLAARK